MTRTPVQIPTSPPSAFPTVDRPSPPACPSSPPVAQTDRRRASIRFTTAAGGAVGASFLGGDRPALDAMTYSDTQNVSPNEQLRCLNVIRREPGDSLRSESPEYGRWRG